MAKKSSQTHDPRFINDRVGVIVTRQQVITLAHTVNIMAMMAMDNTRNIVCSGSSEKSGVQGNPLTPAQKIQAQKALWGDAFKICELQDIGATDRNTDWADYMMARISANQLPEPTDLYAGSKREARWYEAHFASLKGEPSFQRGQFDVWENPETGKRIHILDRARDGVSSSEARALIEARDPAWKALVPAKLWEFYESEYPPHLRVAIEVAPGPDRNPDADFPKEQPVGTKAIYTDDPKTVYLLRDDQKWRVRTEADERKSLGD